MARKGNPFGRGRNSRAPLIAGAGPLAKVPPAAAFAVVIVLFGLAVWLRGPVGAGLLGLLGVGLLVLLAATWQALGTADRVLRVLVLAIVAAVAISLLR
jgi:hypothetical protein